MGDSFLGEIKAVPYGFVPRGWTACDGQLLSISSNQPLFSLLGTTYGGDGRSTFALPDLRGRVPVHTAGALPLGRAGGAATHALTVDELPPHTHQVVMADAQSSDRPAGLAAAPGGSYGPGQVAGEVLQATGGGQPHENRQPYAVLTFVIATQGIFPSRN